MSEPPGPVAPDVERGRLVVEPVVIAAALGQYVAAHICRINGRSTAVINTRARTDPNLRAQAVLVLLRAGIDAGHAMGAFDGIRS